MKLGILVVYLVTNGNDWVLEKHLKNLARTRPDCDFKIYAAANRLDAQHRSLLHSRSFVEIVDLPRLRIRGSAEHGTYLDMLAKHAIADGCDFISTFDMDSWPIRDDWPAVLYKRLSETGSGAAAVFCAENGDTVLPHPSFTFLDAGLFRDPRCRFWIPEKERAPELFHFLSHHEQKIDTGVFLGYFFACRGLPWVRLRRTNKVNYHPLVGGIYDDLIFHLWAGSRSNRIVLYNAPLAWPTKLAKPLGRMPVLWRAYPTIFTAMRKMSDGPVWRRNGAAFDMIAEKLKSNEEALYAELLGNLHAVRSGLPTNLPVDGRHHHRLSQHAGKGTKPQSLRHEDGAAISR